MSETRAIIEGFKAAKEAVELFKEAREKIIPIQDMFVRAVKDDNPQMLVDSIVAVSELDVDDAHGGLIVLLGVMARIKIGLEGTECYDKVKELFAPKES